LIAIKVLRPKAVLTFALLITVSLTTASLTFNFLYSLNETLASALGGLSDGSVIMQGGSRSIYTSMVPVTVAASLNHIQGVKAEAMTLTPCMIRGELIIIRGVSDLSQYEKSLILGTIPKEGGWLLLGEKAQRRLGLKIGEVVFIGSLLTPAIIPLSITGVYRMGDLRDYEAVVSLSTGSAVAGRPENIASIIQVNGLSTIETEALLSKSHALTVKYEDMGGQILILDSSANPIASVKTDAAGSRSISLPFGYYTITYNSPYTTTNITSILLSEDVTVDVRRVLRDGLILKVHVDREARPTLQLEDGRIIEGEWRDGAWIFSTPSGLHTLMLGDSRYPVPMMGDTVFKLGGEDVPLREVEVQVYWRDGSPVDDYLLTVWSAEGELVASTTSNQPTTKLALPEGEYRVEVSKPPYTLKNQLSIPAQSTMIMRLPALPGVRSIPLELFQHIKAVAPVDASTLTLGSLIGITLSAFAALTITLALLSVAVVLSVYRGLHASCRDNLQILEKFGASRWKMLRVLGPVTLLLTLALGFLSTLLAAMLQHGLALDLKLTILGYGLGYRPDYGLAYTVSLGLASWFVSAARLLHKEGELDATRIPALGRTHPRF